MGAEPLRRCAVVVGAHFLPQADAGFGVVTRARGQLQAHQVGLGFVFTAEFECEQLRAVTRERLTRLAQTQHLAEHIGSDIGSGAFAHALAGMLAQGVGDFVAHHGGHFVVGELERVQDAGVKSNLAAGHAPGIDLVAANQIDLPLPALGARVPAGAVGNDALGNTTQALQCGVALGRQCLLLRCLCQRLLVLLGGLLLHLACRHQLGKRGLLAYVHTLAGQGLAKHAPTQRAGCAHRAAVHKNPFVHIDRIHIGNL